MFRLTRLTVPAVVLLALVVFAGTHSTANAQAPVSNTFHEIFTATVPDVVCGETVSIAVEIKRVLHVTEFSDGRYHTHGTTIGKAEFELNGATYIGRFIEQSGENSNTSSFSTTFTSNATVKGNDGSRIALRGQAHVTVNANGEVTVEFERFAGSCPA